MSNESTAELEKKLWAAADKLRGNLDAADYKHVVLGLIFLKYISDAFQSKYDELKKDKLSEPEDKDEYSADNIFWVPKKARWPWLQDNAKQPIIGSLIDEAMELIEQDNASLKGILPKTYARESLDKRRLGELIDLIGTISMNGEGHKGTDLLGHVYEYFLGQFASVEGKKGGEFYTPQSIVRLLVAILQPNKGRIYDPCCGSGGMFVQSEDFVLERQGRIGDIAVYGQELNENTYKLCKMNLAIRHIDGDIKQGDTLHNDKHPDLKADFIMANPPFNISDWGGEQLQNDKRWKYGVPPKGNANFAWMQHFIYHLSPNGMAGFVLSNGSMSSQSSGEGEIRKKIVEADLVDYIITLPGQLFFNVAIPCCLWFLARNRENRTGQTLFIDARNMGHMINRRNKELTNEDIATIADTYHHWKSQDGKYKDVAGFCKAAKTAEIAEHDFVLTPGRYVGSEEVAEDGEAFDEKMKRLTSELNTQFAESHTLEKRIRENLQSIGHSL